MSDLAASFGVTRELDVGPVAAFLRRQRWFGAKSRDIGAVVLLDAVAVCERPLTVVALAEVRFDGGTHEVYQLLLAHGGEDDSDVVFRVDAGDVATVRESSRDPRVAAALVGNTRRDATITSDHGALEFQAIRPMSDAAVRSSRVLDGEQSNTSVIVDDLLLKVYRRVEAGMNPELEMLLFLTEHDFAHVPELFGWYRYVGTPLTTTLGLVQRLLPDARDGWDLALDRVPGTGDDLLPRLRRLGEVVGAMHRVLASEPDDPGFAPEEPTPEAAALLATRVDEQIEVVFADLPDDDAMAPIHGRSEDARTLVRSLGPFTSPGRAIRIHGDLHLAQALWSGDDWSIIDFEGEPARSVAERRMKSLPLRDVAGMFRSFSYAAWAMEARGTPPPPRWEERAREEFLGAYRDSVGGTGLVPDDEQEQHRFLQLFELDKALYELRYEREHRPEWVGVPARAIGRLIDGGFA